MHASNSTMGKFFIKALAFLVVISLTSNVMGTLADRVAPLDDWRVGQQKRLSDLRTRSEQIEAITLGNSHGDAIEYSVLGIEGQSLAFSAADLFEIEKYAAYVADRLPNLRTAFIAISYYSFSRDNATFEPFRTRRIQYYSMVQTGTPIYGDLSNFVLGRLESYTHVMSVVRSDSWKGVWAGIIDDGPALNPFPYDGFTTESAWGTCSHYTAKQLETHARDISKRNVISSGQMAAFHFGLTQDSLDALARTIEELQSQDIRVILFTPTYYEIYNEYFMEQDAAMMEDMHQNIEELQQTYHVEYYDFSQDPEITNQADLFYNSDHLGNCGRQVFSAKLVDAMNAKPE